ncbi:MAG: helix-turn-helix domain-containing protein [Roseococcus sp.]
MVFAMNVESALQLLDERRGQPISHNECCSRAFRRPYRIDDRAIDTLVAKLRSKIEPGPEGQRRIDSLRTVSHVFLGFDDAADDRRENLSTERGDA